MDSDVRGQRTPAPPNADGSGVGVALAEGLADGVTDQGGDVDGLGDGAVDGVEVEHAASAATAATARFTSAAVPRGQYVTRTASIETCPDRTTMRIARAPRVRYVMTFDSLRAVRTGAYVLMRRTYRPPR